MDALKLTFRRVARSAKLQPLCSHFAATFGRAHGVAWERKGTKGISPFSKKKAQNPLQHRDLGLKKWLRGLDLNQRPSGYEPDELPGCSTPRSV